MSDATSNKNLQKVFFELRNDGLLIRQAKQGLQRHCIAFQTATVFRLWTLQMSIE